MVKLRKKIQETELVGEEKTEYKTIYDNAFSLQQYENSNKKI